MIEKIKSWFTEDRAANQDYTSLLLAQSLAEARGFASARTTATFTSCLNLISNAAAIAEVEGQHSESLKPHLGAIARGLTDSGESTWLIDADSEGRMVLLPATVANVTGLASPESWMYSLTQPGPSQTVTIFRPGAAILHFRANATQGTPWRGRPALEASNSTGSLLAALECQLAAESRMKPARLLSIGKSDTQRLVVEGELERGGILAITGASAGDKSPASGLDPGRIRSEITLPQVNLYESLSDQIASALGVPSDLIGSSASEAVGRESFRRFAASTVTPLLTLIQTEWTEKIGPLNFELDALRAGDIAARGRVLSQRATAVKNLVGAGLNIERALVLAGLDE